jgi:hypothetical protein
MIETTGVRRIGWAGACALALALAAWPAAADPASDGDAPTWRSGPLARGPVAGTLAFDDRHVWWGLDGTLPLFGFGRPRANAGLQRQPILGLGLSIAGQATSDARTLRYTALVDRRGPRTGAWLGVSTGGEARDGVLRLGTGLWRSFAPIQVEAGLVSSMVQAQERQTLNWGYAPDSLHWRDTTTFRDIDRSGLATTAQSSVRWRLGRMELAAVGGVTVNARAGPQRWAQATLHVQATPRVLILAAVGQRPGPTLSFDPSAHPSTMMGIQLAPWATHDRAVAPSSTQRLGAWTARSQGDGRTLLRVRCRRAARVELAGDFTDWAPVALDPTGSGIWVARLAIAPGLHQVQIRVDGGAWLVPPGLPAAQGEFAGEAGVLLID